MRKILIFFITAIFLFLDLESLYSQVSPKNREIVKINIAKKNFQLYLLIGQSNMAGRGIVEPQDTIGNSKILRLNREGNWDIAKNPIHFDKNEAGVGPGLSFAQEMISDNNDVIIGLIPCAAGGSSIDNWLQDTFWEQTKTFPYNNALLRAKLAMQYGTLKGIIWHQGEADCSMAKSGLYKEKLIQLVNKLRNDLGIPDLAFVVGELPDFNSCSQAFNPNLYEAKKELQYFDVVSASGFTSLTDGIHIDASSQRKFGKRYALKMKSVLYKQNIEFQRSKQDTK